MTTPIDRPAVEAMIVHLRKHNVGLTHVADVLTNLLTALEAQQATIAARDAEIVRLTKERDGEREAHAYTDTQFRFWMGYATDKERERDALRAQLAAVTAERDEARADCQKLFDAMEEGPKP